jgi:hypothetical protein
MFMVDPPDADGLAPGEADAAEEEEEETDDEETAVLLAPPWQAATPTRPATETTATTKRAAVRGQAEGITGSSLAGAHRVSCGPPGP